MKGSLPRTINKDVNSRPGALECFYKVYAMARKEVRTGVFKAQTMFSTSLKLLLGWRPLLLVRREKSEDWGEDRLCSAGELNSFVLQSFMVKT